MSVVDENLADEALAKRASGLTPEEMLVRPVVTTITIDGPLFGPKVKVTIETSTAGDGSVSDTQTYEDYLTAFGGVEEFIDSTGTAIAVAILKKLGSPAERAYAEAVEAGQARST